MLLAHEPCRQVLEANKSSYCEKLVLLFFARPAGAAPSPTPAPAPATPPAAAAVGDAELAWSRWRVLQKTVCTCAVAYQG